MYKIYPTLLDSFFRYKGSVGYKEAADAKQELINRVNRVREPEPPIVRQGKKFKELVDLYCDKVESKFNIELVGDNHFLDRCEFAFSGKVIKYFVKKLVYSVREVFVSAPIVVGNELVEVYGYVDNVRQDVIYDCKYVERYDLAKYFSSQQRLIYPYCVEHNGGQVSQFEFLATDGKDIFSEVYNWNPKRDVALLKKNIAEFIEFLEKHRNFIADKKIFGEA
jgi:hypothetical protein